MAKKLRVHPTLNKGYGWHRHRLPTRKSLFQPHYETELPSSVDMRANCPPVYDQGQLGSCTANALGGLAEFIMIKQGLNAYVPSRLFIYYNERAIEGTVSEDAGASLTDGATVLNQLGCPNESIWWYNVAKFAVKPNKKVFTDGAEHTVVSMAQVNQDITDMQTTLASGYPIAVGFTVYESFESQQVADTGIVPMPQPDETILGGHAVLVVGYDNSKQWWIVRNSWGTDWGANGYFYMPFAYFLDPDLSDDFWTGSDFV